MAALQRSTQARHRDDHERVMPNDLDPIVEKARRRAVHLLIGQGFDLQPFTQRRGITAMNAEAATEFRPFTSLTEQIADHLTQSIVTGTLTPGERIQEQHVAQALGVSRGSVREALLILEKRHLIEMVPRRGAIVSGLSRRQLDDLFDLLEVLYTMIGKRMAVLWDEEDAIRFDHALTDITMAARANDVDAYAKACECFLHEAMSLIRNCYLDAVVDSLLPLARRALHRLIHLDPELLTEGLHSWRAWQEAMAHQDSEAVAVAVARCFSRHRETLMRVVAN